MRAARARAVDRQVADEGEALAVEAARRERQQRASSRRAGRRRERRARAPPATSGAPGSATRRQARFREQADVVARSAGASRRCVEVGGARLGAPFGGRGNSTIAISCSGRASGTTASTRFRKARVVFAFSHHPVARGAPRCASRRAAARSLAGRRRPSRAEVERVRHEVAARPRHGVSLSQARPQRIDAGRRSSCAGADQRQADQRRRVVRLDGSPAARCPASRILALPAQSYGCLGAQVALDLGIARARESAPSPGPARSPRSRLAPQTTATAVWKTTVRPRIARSCAVARAWSPGLPMPRPSRSATWSEPITTASACARRDRAAFAQRQPHGGLRRRLAGQRRLVDAAAPRRRTAGAGAPAARAGSARSRRG